MNKAEWRAAIQLRLLEFSKDQKSLEHEQSQLQKNLSHFLQDKVGIWGCFYPHQLEPDITVVQKTCAHLQFVFPKMNADTLEFWPAGPLGFAKGPFGVFEPITRENRQVEVKDINGFLIPGLGFDESGHRLGKGKGFYDRLLSHWRTVRQTRASGEEKNRTSIGICWELQVVSKLPVEAHDIPVDALVTNKGVRNF